MQSQNVEVISRRATMAHATDAPVPNATLYVQNLNERIKLPLLKQALEMLFSTYGPVLSVVAHTNLRMRGQAFVSFGDVDTATRALEEVNGFPLYGKGMVRVALTSALPTPRRHRTALWLRKTRTSCLRTKRHGRTGNAFGDGIIRSDCAPCCGT